MGVPIIFIVEDQPSALLFVYTGVIVVVCFSILLLMFVPKIQAIHSKETHNTRSSFFASGTGISGPIGTGGTRISMSGEVIQQLPKTSVPNSMDSIPLESVNEQETVDARQPSGLPPGPESAAESAQHRVPESESQSLYETMEKDEEKSLE
jgi:hypothetical protein